MSRLLVLIYGVVSYFVGVAGLLAIIAAYAGLLPFGFFHAAQGEVSAMGWNLLLVLIWGLLHSGMARQGFKDRLTAIIPAAAERATYVLVAGVTSIALVGYWLPMAGQLWSLQPPLATVIWAVFGFGWVFLLASTFAINHFDLFGLRQVYGYFREQALAPVQFVRRAMYAYIRHPIQTGVLIGIWAVPDMTQDKLLLSIGFTVYIFVGLYFEERDLEALHPEEYDRYKAEVGRLFPRLK